MHAACLHMLLDQDHSNSCRLCTDACAMLCLAPAAPTECNDHGLSRLQTAGPRLRVATTTSALSRVVPARSPAGGLAVALELARSV
jgi:hypothetical protein